VEMFIRNLRRDLSRFSNFAADRRDRDRIREGHLFRFITLINNPTRSSLSLIPPSRQRWYQRLQLGKTMMEVDPRDPNLCLSFPSRRFTSSSTIYSPRPR